MSNMEMIMCFEEMATSLYDDGCRVADRDDLQHEYALSDYDTDILVAYLRQYEQQQE